MTQRAESPRFATDDAYTSGVDDALPNKVEPSTGLKAQGFRRDRRLPAPRLNWQLALVGDHLESVVDSAAVDWCLPFEALDGIPSFTGFGNGLANPGPVVAPGQWYGGIEGEVLLAVNSAGLYYSLDGRQWIPKGSIGHSEFPDDLAVGHYNFAGDGQDYVTIVSYSREGEGEFRASDNFGTSWYNAGTVPAALEDNETHVMGYFEPAKRFFWSARSQLCFFDADADLSTNAEWTRITTSGFWTGSPPASPSCFAASPTECAIGIAGSPCVIRSADGITWAAANTGLSGANVQNLYWSESHQLWIMHTNSTLWTAPAGMAAWTQRQSPKWRNGSALTPLREVACLGRTIVLLAGDGIYVSRDFGGAEGKDWARMTPRVSTGVVENWTYVRNFNGRLWVAHLGHPGGSGGSGSTFECTMSGVLPSALAGVTDY